MGHFSIINIPFSQRLGMTLTRGIAYYVLPGKLYIVDHINQGVTDKLVSLYRLRFESERYVSFIPNSFVTDKISMQHTLS